MQQAHAASGGKAETAQDVSREGQVALCNEPAPPIAAEKGETSDSAAAAGLSSGQTSTESVRGTGKRICVVS